MGRVNAEVARPLEWRWLRLVTILLACVACNPKSGLESAAGAIDPNQKSYIDGPGSRLTAGPFNTVGIDLDFDTGVHLIARRRDDGGKGLSLFGQNAAAGCTISPNALTWFLSKPESRPSRLLPYLETRDSNGRGTLRFSSIDCQTSDYSLPNAKAPTEVALDEGFVVQSGSALVLADPWNGTTRPLLNDFRRLFQTGPPYVIWGDGQIVVFDDTMTELARYGKNVSGATQLGYSSGLAVVDDDGLHALLFDEINNTFSFDVVDPDACAMRSDNSYFGWLMVHSPCADDHLVAEYFGYSGTALERRVFTARGDSTQAVAALLPAPDSDPKNALLAAFFLSDVEPATGLGTLFAAQQNQAAIALGSNASLSAALSTDAAPWAGSAVVNIQSGLGEFERWDWDGKLETLAVNVNVNATQPGILANFNEHSGDLEVFEGPNLALVQSGAPPFDTSLHSSDFQWALRLDHYDGSSGDLMFAKNLSIPLQYGVAAAHVPVGEYEFLSPLPLPGFAYVGDYDSKTSTGTLYVRNESLGATSRIATQVSDFVATSYPLPGILYAVPTGSNAGIWFARAK